MTPPRQPAHGFGGQDYAHRDYRMTSYSRGAAQYWLFEPRDPTPARAPVVIFLHGWGAMNPGTYGAWIQHLVRRGNIVIYPRYQESWRADPDATQAAAIAAISEGLANLETAGHVKPDLSRVAVVGHSMGGIMAANYAASARAHDLPQPAAVMVLQPGIIRDAPGRFGLPLADLSQIPESTLMLVLVGDRDTTVDAADGWTIFRSATAIPLTRRNLIRVQSDTRGTPPLLADHTAPVAMHPAILRQAQRDMAAGQRENGLADNQAQAGAEWAHHLTEHFAGQTVDAMDYYGHWRLLDGLLAAAFEEADTSAVLGDTAQQRNMGRWSSGDPVNPLQVMTGP